jgi:hypothetical protein
VVSDLHAGRGVALHICELRVKSCLVKETRHDVTSIVENDGDIDILGGLRNDGTHRSTQIFRLWNTIKRYTSMILGM